MMYINLPNLSTRSPTKRCGRGRGSVEIETRLKNVEIKNVEMISGVLLLVLSLSCALISPLVVIACFAVLVIGIGAILRPRFALLLLFMGAGLPSITLPLPGHNMHLVEPIIVLV